jgi:phosphatidylserine/phosphatidylglycerophosphate/cardiolipin synthase-like enzyme
VRIYGDGAITCKSVIDGHWSTIGTFNLEYLSPRWLLEVNLCVFDEGSAALCNVLLA